jgi:hypothetical protein
MCFVVRSLSDLFLLGSLFKKGGLGVVFRKLLLYGEWKSTALATIGLDIVILFLLDGVHSLLCLTTRHCVTVRLHL